MSVKRIICAGEAVFDIIFRNEKPVDAKPGGALLNTAVSLGRLGLPVFYAGDLANDKVGRIIAAFLEANGVNCDAVQFLEGARSRLALAFLGENNDADYMFYKLQAPDNSGLKLPLPQKDDIVVFGSYYGIKPEIRRDVRKFLDAASSAGSLIIYDPNIRPSHLGIIDQVRPYIHENIECAHIVKCSDEDCLHIFGTADEKNILEMMPELNDKIFIITRNKRGAGLKSSEINITSVPGEIDVISTIGAGDSFNAGLCYSIFKMNASAEELNDLSADDWQKILDTAVSFASDVCSGYDNYISESFAAALHGNGSTT
jgi:fructokinase